jgi:hypothetical protein
MTPYISTDQVNYAVKYNWYINDVFIKSTDSPDLIKRRTSSGGIGGALSGLTSDLDFWTGIQSQLNNQPFKTICVEALDGSGNPAGNTIKACTDLPACMNVVAKPMNINIDISSSCTAPYISADAIDYAVKYNWYFNDVLIITTSTSDLTKRNTGTGGIGGLGGVISGLISNFDFWAAVKSTLKGQPLKTICVEALNGNKLVGIKTCRDLPSCINGTGGGSGGGGGGGGGGNPKLRNLSQVKIYPNPSSNELAVSINEEGKEIPLPYTVKIFNSEGIEVKSIEVTDVTQKIYTGDLPKEKYIVKVMHGKNVETSRIIIE